MFAMQACESEPEPRRTVVLGTGLQLCEYMGNRVLNAFWGSSVEFYPFEQTADAAAVLQCPALTDLVSWFTKHGRALH